MTVEVVVKIAAVPVAKLGAAPRLVLQWPSIELVAAPAQVLFAPVLVALLPAPAASMAQPGSEPLAQLAFQQAERQARAMPRPGPASIQPDCLQPAEPPAAPHCSRRCAAAWDLR